MLSNYPQMNRRHFMTHAAGSLAATSVGASFASNIFAAAATPSSSTKKKQKHFVMLYMNGGPSHLDTWTILDKFHSADGTDSKNKGDFNSIQTAADGVRIGEVMSETAKCFKDLAVIEAYRSREGDHDRGHTKNTKCMVDLLNLGVQVPGIGAICGYFLGSADSALPGCVTIGDGRAGDSGFLGASYSGFPVQNPGQIPENMAMYRIGDDKMTTARGGRKEALFNVLENNFKFGLTPAITKEVDRKVYQDAAEAHAELYSKAFQVSLKTGAQVFQFNDKDNKALKAGNADHGFGRGCLLASKLIENGVTAVEVGLGGWDMHGNITQAINGRGKELDTGFAILMNRLKQIGKLEDTVVVWLGDFGRTPNINQGMGRDHYGAQWSIVLGGGGIKGGQRYGKIGKDATDVVENPVTTEELFATIYTACGIDLENRNLDLHDNLGRRYYLSGIKENAKPCKALLA
jgi:hypothetical protein